MCLNNYEHLNLSEYYRTSRLSNIISHLFFVTFEYYRTSKLSNIITSFICYFTDCQTRKINCLTLTRKSKVQDTISKKFIQSIKIHSLEVVQDTISKRNHSNIKGTLEADCQTS